ncbi:hypothetical protein [Tellurirhabdus rosea]|uniref:hypothetical protein n=1 Tax=Tellurirhabdus rosea TaxID=2674997 RepID=UPI00224DE605|nr:hypothetical protein [Tellurirhabdus rosea]
MNKQANRFLSLCAGVLLAVGAVACSGNSGNSEASSSEQDTSAQASTDTTVMGLQGDTTTNSVDGPVSAPTDTATGQTLPEATMKVRDEKNR